jgi:hypothetical protein
MTEVSSSRQNLLVERITKILGNGEGTFGYGQGFGYGSSPSSFEVSSSVTSNNNIVTAESINALYADMVRARLHQIGTEPTEIAEIIANANVIAELESFIVDNRGVSIIDENGDSKGILDFENLMQSIENDRFLMSPTQASLELGTTSTRTTVWNDTLSHEFTVTFDNADHRRHFFNSGGEIRISAEISSTNTDKGQSWSQFVNSFGSVLFNYNSTRSGTTGAGTNKGNYQLNNSYQTLFIATGSGFTNSVYNGNEYKIEAKALDYVSSNDPGKILKFKITLNDKAVDNQIDNNIDGTLTSKVEIFRANTDNVRVNTPSITTDFDLINQSGINFSYILTSDKQTVKEGESFTISLNTQNVQDGTSVPYTLSGIQLADFNLTSLTGNFVVNNSVATQTFVPIADGVTEGTETFRLTLINTGDFVSVDIEDQLLPTSNTITCIAVIDEASPSATTIRSSWLSFRSSYPNRPFYLLQPSGYTKDRLRIPSEFNRDNLAFYSPVNRDRGSSSQASDWYSICNIDQLPDGSNFALWIDNSGSMTTSQVRASLNLLDSKIAPRNITYTLLTNRTETWPSPFIRSL